MDNWVKTHEEILATLKRIESSKDLAQFFECIPKRPLPLGSVPDISTLNGYESIRNICAYNASELFHQAEVALGQAMAYLEHPKRMYEYWMRYRFDVQDLSVKKYLEDYMSDHPDDVKDGE